MVKCPRCGEYPHRWGNYRDGAGVVHKCDDIEVRRTVDFYAPDGELEKVWAKYCDEVQYGLVMSILKSD